MPNVQKMGPRQLFEIALVCAGRRKNVGANQSKFQDSHVVAEIGPFAAMALVLFLSPGNGFKSNKDTVVV